MLRSTHVVAPAPPPLPEGWTEHKAPTGHAYYYHAASKKSTYTRPTIEPVAAEPQTPSQNAAEQTNGSAFSNLLPLGSTVSHAPPTIPGHWRVRNPRDDRPKHKKTIPGCEPWILVTTKFRRRFVYNPEVGESFWKFPQDVLIAVAELDRKETIRKERRERGEPSDSEQEKEDVGALDDEYEEVEVTDDEDMDADPETKRQKFEEEKPEGPVEFNEDDFAHQLALMEQGDDEDQFGEAEFEEPELNPDDARDLFCDLLADFRINPYAPWDQVIANASLIEDPRYTCLPNMKSRRDVFDTWSRERIAELKTRREQQEKKDPKIAYIALLDQHASPKLYWPEFKRKYKKEPAMRDTKLPDKDREKLYRDHINRLKLPLSTLKSDLKQLLESQPLSQLNKSSTLETLPTSLITDLRFISLRSTDREPLIEAYIDLLDAAPDTDDPSAEDSAAAAKARTDRERRENALRERERKVEEDRRKRFRQEKASRDLLREGEADIERAMHVRRDGLRGHIDQDKKDEMEE